jgi:pyruvate-formate lyase-activating enzyme
MKEAMFYESMTENRVRCNLCYHRCKIKERKRGVCGVRKNRLKAFTDKLYKEVCGARLNPVLETIRLMKELDVWVEVTTLIIPGLNDGEQELHGIARFVKSVGPEVPWHVSQFYPAYKLLDRPPTPAATLPPCSRNRHGRGLALCIRGQRAR